MTTGFGYSSSLEFAVGDGFQSGNVIFGGFDALVIGPILAIFFFLVMVNSRNSIPTSIFVVRKN